MDPLEIIKMINKKAMWSHIDDLELPEHRIDPGLMIPDDQEELENAHDQELEHIYNFQDALEPGEHLL